MILSELAVEAVKILSPFVVLGAKHVVTAAGEVALEKLEAFVAELRERWSGNPVARDTLERFEENPERYAPMLEDQLKEEMERDEAFAREVDAVVKAEGPAIRVLQEMDEGRDVVAVRAGKARAGTIDVEQRIGKGENVTGVDIDEIG